MKNKIIIGCTLMLFSILNVNAQYANVEKLNESASCDSTCSIDPNKVQTLSGQSQRLGNCGYGYIGSNLEDRVRKEDGSWSEWREVNRDNCACSPLTENQEVDCPTNQRGQHIQTRDWICPSVAQGEYTSWVTKSNTCAYYYLSTSTEEQEISCPSNQRGKHIQTRNYENWSDGNARNHTVWSTKSNTCDYYLTAASQTQTLTASCPAGYDGLITSKQTYDLWSDGGKRNLGNPVVISNTCVKAGPPKVINGIITENCYVTNYLTSYGYYYCDNVHIPYTFTTDLVPNYNYTDDFGNYGMYVGSFNINVYALARFGGCNGLIYQGQSVSIAPDVKYEEDRYTLWGYSITSYSGNSGLLNLSYATTYDRYNPNKTRLFAFVNCASGIFW